MLPAARPIVNNVLSAAPVADGIDIDFQAASSMGARRLTTARVINPQTGMGWSLQWTNTELTNKTGAGSKEGPEAGPIWLQEHHNRWFIGIFGSWRSRIGEGRGSRRRRVLFSDLLSLVMWRTTPGAVCRLRLRQRRDVLRKDPAESRPFVGEAASGGRRRSSLEAGLLEREPRSARALPSL